MCVAVLSVRSVKRLTTTPILENFHQAETADMKVTIRKRGFSGSNGSSFSGVSASHEKTAQRETTMDEGKPEIWLAFQLNLERASRNVG
jgi:hypothetical protein